MTETEKHAWDLVRTALDSIRKVRDDEDARDFRRSASALLDRAFSALPRESFAELLGHIAEEGQRLSKSAPLCLTPGCEKPTGHAPPHEPCGAKPEPVHDFGWALARMREGKKVRRPHWGPGDVLYLIAGAIACSAKHPPDIGNAMGDDWQVVE